MEIANLAVIEAMDEFYRGCNANVHRGVHQLSVEASEAFEQSRRDVARLLNASRERESALAGRRRDDSQGQFRPDPVQRVAAQIRGRHGQYCRLGWPGVQPCAGSDCHGCGHGVLRLDERVPSIYYCELRLGRDYQAVSVKEARR